MCARLAPAASRVASRRLARLRFSRRDNRSRSHSLSRRSRPPSPPPRRRRAHRLSSERRATCRLRCSAWKRLPRQHAHQLRLRRLASAASSRWRASRALRRTAVRRCSLHRLSCAMRRCTLAATRAAAATSQATLFALSVAPRGMPAAEARGAGAFKVTPAVLAAAAARAVPPQPVALGRPAPRPAAVPQPDAARVAAAPAPLAALMKPRVAAPVAGPARRTLTCWRTGCGRSFIEGQGDQDDERACGLCAHFANLPSVLK